MQAAKIVQAVVLIMILALAASCTTTKEYTSKIFPANKLLDNEKQIVALRFLEVGTVKQNEKDMVTTDIIMGRDTISNAMALDNLAKIYPAAGTKNDSTLKSTTNKIVTTSTKNETGQVKEVPIAKSTNANAVREKRTRDEQ